MIRIHHLHRAVIMFLWLALPGLGGAQTVRVTVTEIPYNHRTTGRA